MLIDLSLTKLAKYNHEQVRKTTTLKKYNLYKINRIISSRAIQLTLIAILQQ